MRRFAVVVLASCALALGAQAAAASRGAAPSWASPQIATVVDAGLMGPSATAFRPEDPLTQIDLATVVASLGGSITVTDPYAVVSVKELDAQLVTLVGLRAAARDLRLRLLGAGMVATQWVGTETVARLLGLRINHPRAEEQLELQVAQPVTRAEAAYSVARVLALTPDALEATRRTVESFGAPTLDEWQRTILTRALRFVGSPYVWAGTSERPQLLDGQLYPGGFDCSGFVWRVYKLQAYAGAPQLSAVLRGRTTYAMSAEMPRAARLALDALEPADVVFFGSRGPASKPRDVDHMGIYVGNGWMVHSSRFGTTLTPLTGWYAQAFAWGRRPLAEAGLTGPVTIAG